MGKSDRALVFGLLGLMLGLGVDTGPWITAVLVVVAGLLMLTTARRAARGVAEATS